MLTESESRGARDIHVPGGRDGQLALAVNLRLGRGGLTKVLNVPAAVLVAIVAAVSVAVAAAV